MQKTTNRYGKDDFKIEVIQKRIYGDNFHLWYVHITNKKANKEFENWVRPAQVYSLDELNNLINWGV